MKTNATKFPTSRSDTTDYVNGGIDPRNIFLPLCFSSLILVIAVFLPELAHVRNETLTVIANLNEQILSGGGARASVGHHLVGAVPLTHGRNNLVLQKQKGMLPAKMTG